MKRAIPSAGLEIPAGRDDFGIQGVISLPGDLTKIGRAARPNEGLQLHVLPLAHDFDLEVATTGSSNSIVGGAARCCRARIIPLNDGQGPTRQCQEFTDCFVVLDQLESVGAQLPWLVCPSGDCRSGTFETVDLAARLPRHSLFEVAACDVEHCRHEQIHALYSKFTEGDLRRVAQ